MLVCMRLVTRRLCQWPPPSWTVPTTRPFASSSKKDGRKHGGDWSEEKAAAAEESGYITVADGRLDTSKMQTKMAKRVEALKKSYSGVRPGTATVDMLNGIKVSMQSGKNDGEGEKKNLPTLGIAALKDPRTLSFVCHEEASIQPVMKAIKQSGLDLNPDVQKVAGQQMIVIPVPKLSGEYRATLTKKIKESAEKAKIDIRDIRGRSLQAVKRVESITKDDIKRHEKQVETEISRAIDEITRLAAAKEKELERS